MNDAPLVLGDCQRLETALAVARYLHAHRPSAFVCFVLLFGMNAPIGHVTLHAQNSGQARVMTHPATQLTPQGSAVKSMSSRAVIWSCHTCAARLIAFVVTLVLAVAGAPSRAQTAQDGMPAPTTSRTFTPRVVEKTGPPIDIEDSRRSSEQALRNGVRATKVQCERLDNGIWATTDAGESACLRYWAAGLRATAPSQRAIVYFSGDVWSGGRAVPAYAATSDDVLARAAAVWAGRLGLPYIFLARPGTYGSSGDHMERRRPAESRLASAALDVLKARLNISEFVVVGFSGGGHITSALVTLRSDIVCAVPGGASSSPRMRWELKRWTTDATGYGDSYEPVQHLRKDATHPRLRIFVVGDPRDQEGLWPSQIVMARIAREKGIASEIIEVKGSAPDFHNGQGEIVRLVAGWCGSDLSTQEIVRRAWGYEEK